MYNVEAKRKYCEIMLRHVTFKFNHDMYSKFIALQILVLHTIIEDITFGLVRMYVTPYRFSWALFILGLAIGYTDKLWVFRWVQILLLL